MAKYAQHSDVGRNIEPASGARDDMVTFELFFAAAPLTTTVTMQDERTQASQRLVEPERGSRSKLLSLHAI